MDVLAYLKQRQNELEKKRHPLSDRDSSFRYLYAFGVSVMAMGDMKAITELQDRFQFFLECLSIPAEQREQLMTDINDHFEYRLSECIQILKTKEIQYCFFCDLYHLMQNVVWAEAYCKKVLRNYFDIFHMSEHEIAFFEQFSKAAMQKDLNRAKELYHKFLEEGFDISYRTLRYFYPEFEEEDFFRDIIVKAGKTFHLDKPTQVNGDIVVERGGSLLLDGAHLKIKGSILVQGGRIRIKDSEITVLSCSQDVFMHVEDAAVVRIDHAKVQCQGFCGFLEQSSGRLLIEESEFLQTDVQRAITFCGIYAKIERCTFSEAAQGCIQISDSAKLYMKYCAFIHAKASYGAAVFSDSIDTVAIYDCSFDDCKAAYLGSAVYFQYQKLGQVVKNCVCRNCIPSENAIFNTYDDDFDPLEAERFLAQRKSDL